jgi:hypothetical protein
VLDPDGPGRAESGDIDFRQDRPIAMHIQVTGLGGLTYPIRGLRRDSPITGATYADWGRFRLEPGGGLEQMLEPDGRSPLDFVFASAASPGGFAPQLLDRRPGAETYRRHGSRVSPSPATSGTATVACSARSRLAGVISAARELHGAEEDSNGVHLLIDPRSEGRAVARIPLWDVDELAAAL